MLWFALAFWLLLGSGIFLIALSGGPARAGSVLASADSRFARRLRTLAIFVVFAFGLAVPIAVAVANGNDKARQGPAGITLTPAQATGRVLFAHACATCHTLAAAAAVGHVGPDLDLDPQVVGGPASFVLNAIEQGRARGNGDMPASIYTGQQAKDVAEFVVAVAGRH